MYATLLDGVVQPAPNPVTLDGMTIFNPPGTVLSALGYLPVAETAPPEQDEDNPITYAASWVAQEGQIMQVWTLAEPTEETETPPGLEQRITNLEETVDTMLTGGAS